MNYSTTLKIIVLTIIVAATLLTAGCGGGGGGGNANASNLKANLCPGKLSFENGGDSENILLASVRGSGVSGWIENQNGQKIGTDLVYSQAANTSETMLRSSKIALPDGDYALKYFVSSEQQELKKNQIRWTGLPEFMTSPTPPSWNSAFRNLSVTLPVVSGSAASYYVRLYFSADPDRLYQESLPQSGGLITMQVNVTDEYLIMLIADIIENDQVVATARHVFSPMLLD